MHGIIETKILRSNRRSLSIQILPDASIVVNAPMRMSERDINLFIEKHQEWIEKRIAQVASKKVAKREYQDGEEFLYLGKAYSLKVGDYPAIAMQGDFILFPKVALFRIQKELTNWYIKHAQSVIKEQLDICAKEMKTSYGALTFSDTRSKWGSCTHDNNLQFSWRLIMSPLLVIRYVIIHELAHTREKNHSRSFWDEVKQYNPSYKQQIKWLKDHGSSLII